MLVENPRPEAPSTSRGLKALITGFAVSFIYFSTANKIPPPLPPSANHQWAPTSGSSCRRKQPFYNPPRPNPSSALLPLLPTLIPATPTHPSVQVKTLPPVRVSYDAVLALVPSLARYNDLPSISSSVSRGAPPLSFEEEGGEQEEGEGEEEPDIIIHIGMALPKSAYQLETISHRDGYVQPDVDGKVLAGGVVEEWVREERPEVLDVRLRKSQAEDVWRRWKSAVLAGAGERDGEDDGTDDVQVSLSSDAGRYLCAFVLYASLGFWRARSKSQSREKGNGEDSKRMKRGDEDGPVVVFLHIPAECQREDLERAARVIVALVKALAESCFRKSL